MAIYPPITFGSVQLPLGVVPKKRLAATAGLSPLTNLAFRGTGFSASVGTAAATGRSGAAGTVPISVARVPRP
jgi:hypothetical protein